MTAHHTSPASPKQPAGQSLAGASCSRSLVRVLDRDWQPGRSNFGGGSWMLYLECGHVEWRKASAGTPLRIKCPDCARGRTAKDREWLEKYPENGGVVGPAAAGGRSHTNELLEGAATEARKP